MAGGARLLLVGFLFLAACDSSTYQEVVEVEMPAAIALEPAALQLEEGADRSMTLVDSSKPRRPTVTGDWISWTSSNPGVATVQNGVVKAVGPGVATLTARIGGAVATSSVRVVRTPTELEVRGPDSREVAVATTLNEPVEAVVLSATGRPVPGAEVRFNVVAGGGKVSPVVAETDANGVARTAWTYGLRTGPQQIAVEVLHSGIAKQSIAGQAVAGPAFSVHVTPEDVNLHTGTPFQFAAEFVDVYGNHVSEAVVDWSTSDPSVVQVGADGWATGVSRGEALVVARPSTASPMFSTMAQSPGNGRGNSKVVVEDGQEGGSGATVALMSGNYQTGPVGQRLPSDLAIRVTDASGSGVRHLDITWTVTSGSAVLQSGTTRTNPHGHASNSLTLGTTPGSVTVTATAGSLGSVTFHATAEPGSVATVVVTPGSASMEKGDKRQFTFSASDQFGNAVTDHATPAWSTANTSVASVTNGGSATALSAGSTTVRASIDGVVGTGDLTVASEAAPPTGSTVASVHASTKSVSFTSLGMEATVFAVARDGSGQIVSDASFTWTSSNPGVVSVSPDGKFISKAIGTALVVLSASCCEAASTDTILAASTQVAASIAINPEAVGVKVGSTQGVTVLLKDANGVELMSPGTTTWTSSNGAVMTVSTTGEVKGEGAGSATLTATNSSISTTAPVTVTDDAAPPPAKGSVAPIHAEDFAGYATVKDYLASIPHGGWPRGEAYMDFEKDSPPEVGGQAIRYTFPDATARGGSGRDGRCSGPSIGFDYDLRPLVKAANEVWDEYWVKYSPNWTTLPPAEWECTGNPDHKLVFGVVSGTTGRFGLNNGNNVRDWTGTTPGPNPNLFRRSGDQHWNGEWFRVRRYMRISSGDGMADGRYMVWINDELISDSGPTVVPASEIWGVSLGRNRNHGAAEEMSVSFASFRVWTQNPGW